MRPFLWMVVLLLIDATTASGDPITIGQTGGLHSALLDEERRYEIAVPSDCVDSRIRCPVVYVLGGDELFRYTSSVVEILTQEDLVPAMITVGIPHIDRTRDLATPWSSPDPPPTLQRFVARAGGADRFLEFLTTELAPHIEATHRTAPFRIVVGRSLGGFFALHALFTAPEAFHGYVAISPSMHWDDGVLLREFQSFLEREAETSPRFLFLSIADEGGDTLEPYRRLIERLEYDAPPHLHWDHRTFVDDDHGSTVLPGIHRGLRTVFRGWRAPSDLQSQGLDGFDRHFARLSRRYGYEIPVPEWTIHVLGFRTMAMGDPEEGLRILDENTRRYPTSAVARFRLGTALEQAGRLADAMAQYEQAIALTPTEDPEFPRYQDALRRAREVEARETPAPPTGEN